MKKEDKPEIKSLNENLLTEFSITELEERLETDPIVFGSAVDSAMQLDTECFTYTICFHCGEFLNN